MSKWFVPYNYKGDMLECSTTEYPDVAVINNPPEKYYEEYKTAFWKANDPFKATLTYERYSLGRSAVTMHFSDAQGCVYPIRMKNFHDLVLLLDKGSITGTWKANKRGAYYALVMVD